MIADTHSLPWRLLELGLGVAAGHDADVIALAANGGQLGMSAEPDSSVGIETYWTEKKK